MVIIGWGTPHVKLRIAQLDLPAMVALRAKVLYVSYGRCMRGDDLSNLLQHQSSISFAKLEVPGGASRCHPNLHRIVVLFQIELAIKGFTFGRIGADRLVLQDELFPSNDMSGLGPRLIVLQFPLEIEAERATEGSRVALGIRFLHGAFPRYRESLLGTGPHLRFRKAALC